MRKIHQILADMQYGDAITDNAFAIQKALRSLGYDSEIYAINIHPSLLTEVKSLSDFSSSDCVIHHFAIGSEVNEFVKNISAAKKVLVYHNITPSEFFAGYNLKSQLICHEARLQLKCYTAVYDCALAVSEFNRQELCELGFQNTDILPILYDYEKARIYDRKSKQTNILFLGRIAPNKCQQDVIRAFYYYKKFYNKNASLYIAGAYNGMEKYLSELIHFKEDLKLEDVYFTGRLTYDQMYRLYSETDLFLSMSEHEGFCVPLIECMYYKIPIIAYAAGAVPETLGNSGVVFKQKDFKQVAAMMDEILSNDSLRSRIITAQNNRLKDFSYDAVSEKLKGILKKIRLD